MLEKLARTSQLNSLKERTLLKHTIRVFMLPAVAGLLALASIAHAQVAFDSVASANVVDTTLTWSHTVGAGPNRLLVVSVSCNDSISATSVTFAGMNLTRQVVLNTLPETEIWTLVSPPSGAANVVVTLPATRSIVGGSVSFTGVDQVTPVRDHAGGTSTRSEDGNGNQVVTTSVSVATLTGDMVIDVVGVTTAGPVSVLPASGQTQRWYQTGPLGNIAAGSTKPGSAGSTTMSWTLTADNIVGNNSAAISLTAAPPPCTGPSITSLTATPNVLWPPNGSMAPVALSNTISGGCGSVSCKILSVTSSEPIDAGGDWVFSGNPGDLNLTLRAQRLGTRVGTGNGRTYTITLQCTDAQNNSTTKTVTVLVPHDQGH